MSTFKLTLSPGAYRERVLQRFTKATKEYKRGVRDQMRRLGRDWVRLARAEAPQGKTGKFKRGIGFRTFARGGDVMTLTTHMPQPLGKWITKGTKAHWIQAKSASALSFFWPKVGMRVLVPKRGGFKTHVRNETLWIGKGGVNHPGTKANPFHKRAYRQWRPLAKQMLKRITHKWQVDFTS